MSAPWGFEPEEIGVPVCVFQGGDDELVPADWGATLADRIPQATLRTYPGEGHFIALTRSDDVLDFLANSDERAEGG
jgi:pimeloyl-ACP methyl ester carboxylesterase